MESVVFGDRLVSRREAAQLLGLQPQTLAKWAMTGKILPVVRIGRSCRYRLSDVNRLIAEGSNSQAGQAA
jgi:excisionase family DNA binding protein